MNTMRLLGPGLLSLLVLGGCESAPTVTRTGDVKDIIIGDKLSATAVSVNPGDEVRWINTRTAPVRIIFLDPVDEKLSCKNNIGGWMTRSDTIRLGTSESASACFREVGPVRYTVRMESALPTGELNAPGIIQVGGRQGDAAARTQEQNKGWESDQFKLSADGESRERINAPMGATSITTTTTTMPSK